MSLPRGLARIAVDTVGATLTVVQFLVWVPLGLLLFLGVAGLLFAPVFQHLATYWWVYLAALFALVALLTVVGYYRSSGERTAQQYEHSGSSPSHAPSIAGRAASPGKPRISQTVSSTERPTSGLALSRYTDAWIGRNGLYEGHEMSKAEAVAVAGRTAISYHLREGNFIEREGTIGLTAKGKSHFSKRRSRL
jgi:hypothetical protein